MKRIGIDARLYSQTGVGTYLKNLIYYLEKKDLKDKSIYVYLLPEDYKRLTFKNKKIIKRKVFSRWHTVGEQINFAWRLYFDNLDVMHFTYFSYPVLYLKKFVATVHDITPLIFKTGKASTKNNFIYNLKHLFFRIILRCQIERASRIITPTLTVKTQLEKIYGKKISEKISPIYEGVNYQMINSKENKSLSKKFNDFFIYVGNFYPHKNVERLIRAFSGVITSSKLLLLGPNDFFKNRLDKLIGELKQEKRILFVNGSKTEDIVFFYKNARALIHPSLSEGFGLPLIEASYFACPIIASNIQVFKELLENNYLSFDPNDSGDIAIKIKYFIDKKPKFNFDDITKKYSFKKMTDKTFEIYQEVLSSNI
jgi:glycosyltransferase involved in cell wall biosynthesis